jgi:hypothetical protein
MDFSSSCFCIFAYDNGCHSVIVFIYTLYDCCSSILYILYIIYFIVGRLQSKSWQSETNWQDFPSFSTHICCSVITEYVLWMPPSIFLHYILCNPSISPPQHWTHSDFVFSCRYKKSVCGLEECAVCGRSGTMMAMTVSLSVLLLANEMVLGSLT